MRKALSEEILALRISCIHVVSNIMALIKNIIGSKSIVRFL